MSTNCTVSCTAEVGRAAGSDAAVLPSATLDRPPLCPQQIRVLELTCALSRDLDLLSMTRRFSEALQVDVSHDGLELEIATLGLKKTVGRSAWYELSRALALTDQELGTLKIYRDKAFTASEAQQLDQLADTLVYPLRNAIQYQTALRHIFRDPLTGLNNRAALDLALPREVDLATREGTPMSLMIFDTDNFKEINDSHGHIVGDRVLQAIADALAKTIRNTDAIHRYGGDEFVVTLGNANVAGAMRVAERVRATIESLRVTEENVHIMVSVSVGLAEHRPGEGFAELFQRADQALYRAKQLGRNRVVIA